jgi:catechol 2,3-dioxygenase-like lactoylglutathione lyase family enzyme
MPPAAEIIGLEHIYLTVSSVARSEEFYDRVLRDVLGFRKKTFELGGEPHVHYYNRHFGVVLRPRRAAGAAHDRYAPGLHHLCLRVATPADVDRAAEALGARGVEVTPPRLYVEYAPDYRAVFLDDPDGLRVELTNFRAERRARLEHWDTCDAPEPAAG